MSDDFPPIKCDSLDVARTPSIRHVFPFFYRISTSPYLNSSGLISGASLEGRNYFSFFFRLPFPFSEFLIRY